MLNKYTVIYRLERDNLKGFGCPQTLRKDVIADDEVAAAAQVLNTGKVLHVIKHEPIDHSEPAVRFLDRAFHGKAPARGRPSEGCRLVAIECTPTTDLDFVRHELWSHVLKVLDLGDASQCDQYLLDDALNDADIGNDHPFDLNEWPYDDKRFEVFEADKDVWIVIDWDERRKATFDCQGDALAWCTPPYEKAVLLFEVWPGA